MEAQRNRGRIVVGVDGSHGSEHALSWALDDARARQLDVEAVHAWNEPVSVYPANLYAGPAAYEAAGAKVLAPALSVGGQLGGDLQLTSRLMQEDAASALLEASKDAELLVVGSRGRGGFTGLLLGSVSRTCLHLATIPVVVVPPEWAVAPTRHIVVGVDGSPSARAALSWALTEAAAHDSVLRVVNVYDLAPYVTIGAISTPPDDEFALKTSRALLEELTEEADDNGVEIELLATSGAPARTLLDAAEHADLLVVGSRGLGTVRRLLVGSVSQQCVYHSTCPVAVVRPPVTA